MDLTTAKQIFGLNDILECFQLPLDKAGQATDLLHFVLSRKFEDTHLPALYEVLGRDAFLKVLDIFQDTEMIPCPSCRMPVKWPARDELAQIMRDLVIYFRVKRAKHGRKSRTIEEMATLFKLTPVQVKSINRAVTKLAKELETICNSIK